MNSQIRKDSVVGLVRPSIDAHTLGLHAVQQLLGEVGIRVVVGGREVRRAVAAPSDPDSVAAILAWLDREAITHLGFSYRLDPDDAVTLFGKLVHQMLERQRLRVSCGRLQKLFFAGLPKACDRIAGEHGKLVTVFYGDETPSETLQKLQVPVEYWSQELAQGASYDSSRLRFGEELIRSGEYLQVGPPTRDYPEYGGPRDGLLPRLNNRERRQTSPVTRAHAGPYHPNRTEAVREFLDWCRSLAASGYLDVLSIGTSQLTQARFGESWGCRPNGGGVPLNSPAEFAAIWEVSRPMLVRTYAGTKDIAALAEMYEKTINIAWHALSLWWFCQTDGRGAYGLAENLREHCAALRLVARHGKPYEGNVSHHFAFRGADDVTYVVAGVLAARVAKVHGIRTYVLQNMLNTPKSTWGVQDLAKARALLALVRPLEEQGFRVVYQPRAGLDYFSHNADRAKSQLAAATALMDDVEPHRPASPELVHVVSYSEGASLATPEVINESVQITVWALHEYRRLRRAGHVDDMTRNRDVDVRTVALVNDARAVLTAMEKSIPGLYTPWGLEIAFRAGFLPVPDLACCREEFPHATAWRTRLNRGEVKVVDAHGRSVSICERVAQAADIARDLLVTRGGCAASRRTQ